MSDEWDEEDFDGEEFDFGDNNNPATQSNFDDEEDMVEAETVEVPKPSAATIAAQQRKATEEERLLALKVQETLLEGETEAERKLRLKKEVEAGEIALANDLFDGVGDSPSSPKKSSLGNGVSLTSGMGASLKTNTDHVNFAITVATKLKKSTALNLGAFYAELNRKLIDKLDLTALTTMSEQVTKLQKEKKKKAASGLTAAEKAKKARELKKEQKRQQDLYGGDFSNDPLDEQFGGIEDDYVF